MDEIFLEIKEKLYKIIDDSDVLTDEALCEYIDECIYNNSKTRILSIKQREELKKRLFNSIRRLDVLQELLEDDSITEIMINGYKNIFIEKNGISALKATRSWKMSHKGLQQGPIGR